MVKREALKAGIQKVYDAINDLRVVSVHGMSIVPCGLWKSPSDGDRHIKNLSELIRAMVFANTLTGEEYYELKRFEPMFDGVLFTPPQGKHLNSDRYNSGLFDPLEEEIVQLQINEARAMFLALLTL